MAEKEKPDRENTTETADGSEVKPKKRKAGKIAAWVLFIFFSCLAVVLLVNALLSVFVPHYYPTFGDKRLFSIVSNSMEPEIPTGSLIVSRKPKSRDEITVGTVITFEVRSDDEVTLLTHRVVNINTDDEGSVTYVTRGDNAGGVDPVRPSYDDVVGIYTGSKCGGWGYVFGFLQSTEGAIALILIVAILALAYIIVRLVNTVNMWRTVAADALKTSGSMLANSENDGLNVIADVIGIAVKEPKDRKEARRKDKKLQWFMKTGSLPKRPYADDLDVDAEMQGSNSAQKLDKKELSASAAGVYVKEPFDGMSYKVGYRARIIMLDDAKKEWYSSVKNALLRYDKVRCAESNKGERFVYKGKTVARIAVVGKTPRLTLAVDPEGKKGLSPTKDGKQSLLKITSKRRCALAVKTIDEMMAALGVAVNDGYTAQDYFVPYEGIVSLMQRGLIVRDIKRSTKVYRVEEVSPDAAPPDVKDE